MKCYSNISSNISNYCDNNKKNNNNNDNHSDDSNNNNNNNYSDDSNNNNNNNYSDDSNNNNNNNYSDDSNNNNNNNYSDDNSNKSIKYIIAKLENEYKMQYYDIKKLLKFCLKVDDKYLIIHNIDNLDEKIVKQIFIYAERIKSGIPIQYLINEQDFMGQTFYVNKNVLIPQPDTEIVVQCAINKIKELIDRKVKAKNIITDNIIDKTIDKTTDNTDINTNDLIDENYTNVERTIRNKKIKILDLCTGSGAIGISIKKYFGESVDVTLSDISKDALDVAKLNAKNILSTKKILNTKNISNTKKVLNSSEKFLNSSEKILNSSGKIDKNYPIENSNEAEYDVNFVQSDMFHNIKDKFDLIVSNPPYIRSKLIDELDEDVKNEPHIALDGGSDGLKFYKIIKSEINNFLNKDGYLILEIGYDQKEEVQKMFENSECIKDYAGNDRVIIWKR